MRQAQRAFRGQHLLDGRHRIGHQHLQRDALVRDAVDERGVRAVFQQSAYQVSQQGFVAADRRIDAARTIQTTFALADHLFVQRLAHAVQALELVLAGVIVRARELIHGGKGMGVVCGELRIDRLGRREQLAGAGDEGHVGVSLAGIDRVAFQPVDLRKLDFAVPVSAFDQTDHQPMVAALGQIDQKFHHVRAPLLIGLDDKADAVPVVQRGFEAEPLEEVQ